MKPDRVEAYSPLSWAGSSAHWDVATYDGWDIGLFPMLPKSLHKKNNPTCYDFGKSLCCVEWSTAGIRHRQGDYFESAEMDHSRKGISIKSVAIKMDEMVWFERYSCKRLHTANLPFTVDIVNHFARPFRFQRPRLFTAVSHMLWECNEHKCCGLLRIWLH